MFGLRVKGHKGNCDIGDGVATLSCFRQRFRDIARTVDEELRHWAERPVLQGDDSHRSQSRLNGFRIPAIRVAPARARAGKARRPRQGAETVACEPLLARTRARMRARV